jgi:hypothetical protein
MGFNSTVHTGNTIRDMGFNGFFPSCKKIIKTITGGITYKKI